MSISKKRKSRHGKKNQRKNCDISDLEKFKDLEEVEKLQGGPVEKRPNKHLFFEDTQIHTKRVGKSKIEYWRKRLLSYEKQLLPNPFVAPVCAIQSERKATRNKSQKHIKKSRSLSLTKSKASSLSETALKSFRDLWNTNESGNFSEEKKPTREIVKKLLRLEPPNSISAVEIPGNYYSYNPPCEEHQDTLDIALEETPNEEEEEKERSLETSSYPIPASINAKTREENGKIMTSEGIHPVTLEKESQQNESIIQRNISPRKNKRLKTTTEQKLKTVRAKISQDIERLPDLLTEVINEEEIFQQRSESRNERKQMEKMKTKKLGRYPFQEPKSNFPLTQSLRKPLRSLKETTDPLAEKFQNFQRRNLIEVRYQARYFQNPRKIYNKKNMDIL